MVFVCSAHVTSYADKSLIILYRWKIWQKRQEIMSLKCLQIIKNVALNVWEWTFWMQTQYLKYKNKITEIIDLTLKNAWIIYNKKLRKVMTFNKWINQKSLRCGGANVIFRWQFYIFKPATLLLEIAAFHC